MGVRQWSDGRKPLMQFSTYAYGHPNQDTIDALHDRIDRLRGGPSM
jgi:hypothetical protein